MNAGRWLRTLRHLEPEQVAHRVRLRTQRAVIPRCPGAAGRLFQRAVPEGAGWPRGHRPLDGLLSGWPSLEELADRRITLLGLRRPLDDWRPADAPQLWRYHLQYWDWAWGLVGAADADAARRVFADLWRAWSASARLGRYDEWSPYAASVRAWSLCGLYEPLARGGPVEAEVRESLGLHAGFLAAHVERDVGGNHLVKNVKALAGLGVFLGDATLTRRAVSTLVVEAGRQVLPDGGHYERAPAYHCQVLADLVDVRDLLAASGVTVPGALDGAVTRMRRWLSRMLLPDGSVPMLNDGFPVPAGLVALLARPDPAPFLLLPDSGYVVARAGRFHLLADVGAPCPDELPAHAHADTLSFLLHDEGMPVVVDTGTSTYEPGPRRDLERSTRAHSTIEIDGEDSTEVYGAFRAGRRARARVERVADAPSIVVQAAHDGYRHLPGRPVHRRSWKLTPERLRITDTVWGGGSHRLVSRLVLAPEADVAPGKVGRLRFDADRAYRVSDWEVAVGWQERRASRILVREERAGLPTTMWMEFAT